LFASEPFAVFPSGKNVRAAILSLLADLTQGASCRSEHEHVKTFVDSGDPILMLNPRSLISTN
jgi:hypothetical protein